ncbi:MAG: hypothetical protein WBF77_09265 [Sulfurimonadaceae bacterium]
MYKTFLLILFLAGISLASEVDLHSPSSAVTSYYDAMNEGDLVALKQIMVQESFDMDVQVYALSIALKDPDFHTILKQYANSDEAREIVKKEVAKKLRSRSKRAATALQESKMGSDRFMVRFMEDTKAKQLYLSKHNRSWKIDYKAGRKTN